MYKLSPFIIHWNMKTAGKPIAVLKCQEIKKRKEKSLWQLLTGALNLFSHFYSITYLVWSAETYFLPKCFFQHQHIWCVQLKPLVFQNVYSNISRFCVISWNILTYKMFLPTAVSFVWSAEISCVPKCLFQQKLMVLAETSWLPIFIFQYKQMLSDQGFQNVLNIATPIC